MNAAWKTIRVFISSTFRDMQAERDWLVRFVFPKLKERLLKHRIHFVDVDLRWGVTGEEDAGEVCREVIGECRPRFLGMLGGRYGWVPPPKRIAADDFNALLSGTTRAGPLTDAQREALHALYSRSESGGDFRLRDKPMDPTARKMHDSHCQTVLPVLQRAGLATSITADEIDFGVLNPPPNDRGPVRAFFYFRDEAATKRMVEEKPGDYCERDGSDSARDLAALKQTIVNGGLPVFVYDAQWDTADKRLTGLKKFGNRVLCDLFRSIRTDPDIAAHFTTDSTATPDDFAEERAQMDAFIEERVDQYILGSRKPLMNQLLTFANADGTPNILVLTGAPGSGKSALLAKFCRVLSSTGVPPVCVPGVSPGTTTTAGETPATHTAGPAVLLPHFIGASTGSTDLRRTLRRLCHELAKVASNTEPLPLDIKDLITHFQKLLAEAGAKTRIILVFDALNQFDATDGAHWMNWLPSELPPGVRIIASVIAPAQGEKEHQTLAILGNRKDAEVVPLAALKWQDTVRIIRGYLKRYSKRMSKSQKRALLKKPASNLPLYVLTALEELRTLGTDDRLCELATKPLFQPEELERLRREDHDAVLARFIEVELPGTAVELFQWILQTRLSKDPILASHPRGAPQLIEQFAACLGVSRHGLSPAELTALLDPGDPLGNVAALLRLLRPYLMRRGELLDFYHGQFREAAGAAHLDTPEKQRAAHQSVATCLQAFADPHRDGQCRDGTPHALSELPHHQTRAEAWPDLIATLENIFFLEAKVTHGMTFDLAVDFTVAVEALPLDHPNRERLRLLDEALRRDIHFITLHAQDYPQAFFQCLWNSAWWYDCPEAAPYYKVPEGRWNEPPPWDNANHKLKLSPLMVRWHTMREAANPAFPWLRSQRPPSAHLGTGQLAILRGHEQPITSVAISPDGARLLSGGGQYDQTLRLWDAKSGKCIAVLRGHGGTVTSVAFSPDGNRLLSGGDMPDNTLRLWDAQGGECLAALHGHEGKVMSVAFSPDGSRLLSGSSDRTLRLWDIQTGACLLVLRGHEDEVSSVAFSPDGNRLLSGAGDYYGHKDNTLRLWDARTGECLRVLRGHEGKVTSVAFSPDGSRLLSGSGSYHGNRDWMTLRLWKPETGECLAVLRGHERSVNSVAFSPDGKRLASGSDDGTLRVRDARNWKCLAVLRGQRSSVSSVAFSPDGRHLLSGSEDYYGKDNTLRLWDARGGQKVAVLLGHEDSVMSVAFSPDGIRLLNGSSDKSSRLWDAASGECLVVLNTMCQSNVSVPL